MGKIAFNAVTTRGTNKAGMGHIKEEDFHKLLGPGSYYQMESMDPTQKLQNKAPFNCAAKRAIDEKVLQQPGPGEYKIKGLAKSRVGGAKSAFNSKFNRFKEDKPHFAPGPGTYNTDKVTSGFQKAAQGPSPHAHNMLNKQKGGQDKVKWVRVPTAPSIPAHAQSYGYEEGTQGELIMQKPLYQGYGGEKEDSAGPCDYEPRLHFVKEKRNGAMNFAKYSGRETMIKRALHVENPGPGAYNTVPQFGEGVDEQLKNFGFPDPKKRASSVFKSTTKRAGNKKEVQRAPGPGYYKLPGAIQATHKPESLQFFGSTSKRFDGGPREKFRLYGGPGPGSYNTASVNSSFENKHLKRQQFREMVRSKSNPVGFDCTDSRFKNAYRIEHDAAPGSYEAQGLADEVSKRLAPKGGAFGTSSKRFIDPSMAHAPPAPGKYDLAKDSDFEPPASSSGGAHNSNSKASSQNKFSKMGRTAGGGWNFGLIKGKDYQRETSGFASLSNRFSMGRPKQLTEGPPPGHYDITTKLILNRAAVSYDKGAPRFTEPDDVQKNLGPGKYNLGSTIQKGKGNRKNIMLSNEGRFGPNLRKYQSPVPGPGAYQPEPYQGSMVKPTYNAAIAEASIPRISKQYKPRSELENFLRDLKKSVK